MHVDDYYKSLFSNSNVLIVCRHCCSCICMPLGRHGEGGELDFELDKNANEFCVTKTALYEHACVVAPAVAHTCE